MSTLIAITYDDQQTARNAFDALGRMQKEQILVIGGCGVRYQG